MNDHLEEVEQVLNLIEELADNPHLDATGEYHGDPVWLIEPCPYCGSAKHYEQYDLDLAQLIEGCEVCEWRSC